MILTCVVFVSDRARMNLNDDIPATGEYQPITLNVAGRHKTRNPLPDAGFMG